MMSICLFCSSNIVLSALISFAPAIHDYDTRGQRKAMSTSKEGIVKALNEIGRARRQRIKQGRPALALGWALWMGRESQPEAAAGHPKHSDAIKAQCRTTGQGPIKQRLPDR
jgi:hypothetical protein